MTIDRIRLKNFVVLVAVVVFAFSCNFSTANLNSLKIGKDRTVSQEADTFSPNDTVYGVTTVSNNPGKVKVKGHVVIEDVPGQQPGPIPESGKTVDVDGDGTVTFTFTPPADGWPKGKYKVEVTMMNEQGEQKDQKTGGFTVS